MELRLARESLKADSQSQNITFEEINLLPFVNLYVHA